MLVELSAARSDMFSFLQERAALPRDIWRNINEHQDLIKFICTNSVLTKIILLATIKYFPLLTVEKYYKYGLKLQKKMLPDTLDMSPCKKQMVHIT